MSTYSRRVREIDLSGIRRMFELAGSGEVLNLALGEPDFDTPEHIRQAAKQALDAGLTHYTPSMGLQDLREAICEKYEREYSLDISPSQVLITAGASEALLLAFLAIVDEGDSVMIPRPYFVSYNSCARIAGARIVHYEMEDDLTPSIDDIQEKATRNVKLIVVNSPNNPTGAVYDRRDLRAIAEIASDLGAFVLSDEVYEKIIYDGRHACIGEFSERFVLVNSFSKTYAMTGWRVGFAISDESTIGEMLKIHQYNSVCIPAFSQIAALAALRGPQDFVEKMVEEFRRRRDLVCKMLREIGLKFSEPKGAFYVFPRIPDGFSSSREFVERLVREKGVLVVPGTSFGMDGFFRISYATSINALEEAMRRLEDFVR